jgi:hypothetical protein
VTPLPRLPGWLGSCEIRDPRRGVLDAHWSSWFDGLQITNEPSGVTVIAGPVADQAALHGLLVRIHDLGLPLISVHRIDPRAEDEDNRWAPASDHHLKSMFQERDEAP